MQFQGGLVVYRYGQTASRAFLARLVNTLEFREYSDRFWVWFGSWFGLGKLCLKSKRGVLIREWASCDIPLLHILPGV